MAFLQVKNNASSVLAADITDVATSLSVAAGEGARFPTSNFHITIEDEILKCATRAGDVLTVTRAQEGTAAAAHATGKAVRLNITAAIITELQTTPPDHASRHKWLGADELNIKDLFFAYFNPYYYKSWQDFTGFTELLAGTGATAVGFVYATFSTGATSGSKSCRYCASNFWLYKDSAVSRFRLAAKINPRSLQTNQEVWLGVLETPNAPSNTQKHVAFKISGNILYASCGDGAAGTQVDTGVTTVQYEDLVLYFKYMADDIKFYVNGVLKATITTNRPSAFGPFFTFSVVNSAAEQKQYLLYPFIALSGDE